VIAPVAEFLRQMVAKTPHPVYHSQVMNTVRIAPSILSADFARLGDQVREAENAGADVIHVDVMDGHFVPNITIGPLVVSGADILTVHPEATPHLHRVVQQIHSLGVRAGVALNPATPESVLQYVLSDLDLVLVMTVNPGFGGQKLIPEAFAKMRAVREMLDRGRSSAWLSVDGGIDAVTAPQAVAHGADTLVAGSAIYSASEGVAAAIHALRGAVAGA